MKGAKYRIVPGAGGGYWVERRDALCPYWVTVGDWHHCKESAEAYIATLKEAL